MMRGLYALAALGFSCAALSAHAQLSLGAGWGLHCSAQANTLSLGQGGSAVFASDWAGIGDCRIGRTSSIRVVGNTLQFNLLVKTDHTNGTDVFHVQYRLNTGASSAVIDGPGMHNGQPFQNWSGTTSLSGATAGASSITVGACC